MADRIECPYCEEAGEKNEIDYEDHPWNMSNGGDEEYQCPYCEKLFMVTMSIEWSTDKFCQLNNEEHVFEEQLPGNDTLFCKNCEEVKLSQRRIDEIRKKHKQKEVKE